MFAYHDDEYELAPVYRINDDGYIVVSVGSTTLVGQFNEMMALAQGIVDTCEQLHARQQQEVESHETTA